MNNLNAINVEVVLSTTQDWIEENVEKFCDAKKKVVKLHKV